ncbi:MAG TPA: CmcI family methyltransferase [Pyrinomonadaceae bacterium]
MRVTIDTEQRTMTEESGTESRSLDLYSKEAFEIISNLWVKVGWNEKYSYTFSWLGRPIVQLPEDMIRIQEVIYRIKPDVIIETGVAHGGSLIYYATLCKAFEKGRVVGIDIEIRPHNRNAIEGHELSSYITLVEGSSTAPEVLDHVRSLIKPGESVLVILDSNHTRQHVLDEMRSYCDLVTKGSYLVATDGIMKDFNDVPRGNPEWIWDNPNKAAQEFAAETPQFLLEQPPWPFNESKLTENVTHWPGAWLRRL